MQLRTATSTGDDGHIPMPQLKALDGNRASSYQISPPLLDSLEHVAGGISLGGIPGVTQTPLGGFVSFDRSKEYLVLYLRLKDFTI